MSDLHKTVSDFLHSHGLKLNTDLGQHFLIDEEVLSDILDSAAIEEDDHIVEIGPGIGVLTKELVQDARKVTAIEVDPRLPALIEKFVGNDHRAVLDIVLGNALSVSFPHEPYKIVANIPYHITSPLLRHAYLESFVRPSSITVLIQREVAEKICDTESAGMLTVIVALFGTPSIVRRVAPESFVPPPEVDSAVLHIASHPEPLAARPTIDQIFRLAKLAFGQKRKMLRNSLGSLPEGLSLMKAANVDPQRRPETLTIQEWIALAHAAGA